jgi:hypothetical protein
MPVHPPAPPADPNAPPPPAPLPEEEVHIFELVEDAAQAAEGALDQELEDIITTAPESQGPDDPPAWATNPDQWREAAEAVGLGAGAEDKYEEPFVVTCYLYKMIGGPIEGGEGGKEEGDLPPDADMAKPGAAAKAIHARGAARAAAAPPAAPQVK